jgi:flagellar biosynthesis protein FlhB
MIILIYWGDLVTKFLFAPIDIKFALYATGPIPIINRFYNPAKFVNIFRSVFTAVSIWMIYLIYKDNKNLLEESNNNYKI